ncbi:tumor necrosis factor ligand superfamily member 10-like [Osmerus mordax]|uniref:tumor necrosis factor ligand superfamily member 10-like n=1 Tax=Osmerus mordax TaxID=8014 RepID=UPI003510736A
MPVSLSQQCLGLIVLGTIFLQTIAVAISFMLFNNVLETMHQSFSRSSVSCLLNPNVHPGRVNAAGGEQKADPCWQVMQQLHYRIEKTMAERLQREVSAPVINQVSGVFPVQGFCSDLSLGVSAHVTGGLRQKQPPKEGSPSSRGFLGERIREWDGQRGLSFLQNVELKGGELLVPRAGLYFIYAQTYFSLPPTEETEGDASEEGTQLIQYIYKKMNSYSVPILLMKSSRSACWFQRQESGLFSLHQAGTARLQPADRLFVTVSNASAVETDARASYFGAFLVG